MREQDSNSQNLQNSVVIRTLDIQEYTPCWRAMRQFTDQRHPDACDEIWLLQHQPVFTQGQNGKAEHILNPGDIPIVQTDRGGQVTYHGPGQLMVYTLIDLQRKHWHVRELVSLLEQTIIQLLAEYQIDAHARKEAPGVYVQDKKICSIGLRIRRGCSYHGLAFNIDMALEPFQRINPCGFASLQMTQLSAFNIKHSLLEVSQHLIHHLVQNLQYSDWTFQRDPLIIPS